MEPCRCADCRYPTVGDPEVKTLHAGFHATFDRLMESRPDRHGFTPPSPSALVVMATQEYDVPARCPRAEHAGAPQHPVHRQ